MTPSLKQALSRSNALGLIRLVLAALVIVDHAVILGGFSDRDLLRDYSGGQTTLGTIAVLGFFGISGYLITRSGERSDVVQFFWHRVLRIFPAFWVVLIVAAFIVGPVLTWLEGTGLAGYFGSSSPYEYVLGDADLYIRHWGINDLLLTTPYGQEVGFSVFNGSLWTLWYEFMCYVIIGIFALFTVLGRARIIVPITCLVFLVLVILDAVGIDTTISGVPWIGDSNALAFTFTFLVGATFAITARRIPTHWSLAAAAAVLVLVTLSFGLFSSVGAAALVYLVLWLGARLPAWTHRVGAKNDYSYGTYLYGFLVQQLLAYAGFQVFGYFPYLLVSLVLSVGLAWCSWHGIEKHALRLKHWGPGRGIRYWWERRPQRA